MTIPTKMLLILGDSTADFTSLVTIFNQHYSSLAVSSQVQPYVKGVSGAFVQVTPGTVLPLQTEVFFLPRVWVRTATLLNYPHEQARLRIVDKAIHHQISGSIKRIPRGTAGDTALHFQGMAYDPAKLDAFLEEVQRDGAGSSLIDVSTQEKFAELFNCKFDVHAGGPKRSDSKESAESIMSYALSGERLSFYG